ncbi:AAT family amino acid transporter [Xylariales sp. PMI_506]|nr:AAT family amino acid transporter [Xylariales sp. PMI_506]
MLPTDQYPSQSGEKFNNDQINSSDLSPIESVGVGQSDHVAQQHLSGTKRNIKSRHAQMIAMGGSIGTGFFVGTGQSLAIGGPAILFVTYALTSLLVYGVMTAVVEVGAFTPASGSTMASLCNRYLSRSLGFAMGWLYVYSFSIIVAYEITAATIVIDFWPNNVNTAVFITVFLIIIIALNFCSVGIYAETEFWFASIKVVMIVGLLVLSLVLMLGGGPSHQRLGFYYWQDPGVANSYIIPGAGGRFTAFLYVWVYSGFAFYFSPELVILTSGEMRNPRKNLPKASKRFFWRLIVFYILGTLAIGVICKSNSADLTSSSGNANASPFVIAIRNAGIQVLPSIINVGILTSAWSSGNSYLYMASRSLYSLAVSGNAPKIFTRCNRLGTPIYSVGTCSLFALLAFLSCNTQAGVVFNWLISLTNTAGYTSWIMCCIVLIRFRKGCEAQGVEVPCRSRIQPYAAWICLFFLSVLLLANGFTLFYPGQFTVSGFFTTYVGIPLFIALWLGHKLTVGRQDAWLTTPKTMDFVTDVREVEADAEMWNQMENDKEQAQGGGRQWWKFITFLWN